MRKALIVGINNYPLNNLNGPIQDACKIDELLSCNYDGSRNFDTKVLKDQEANSKNLLKCINDTFNDAKVSIGLFYFSGHGYDDEFDGGIVCLDSNGNASRLPFSTIMDIVNKAKCRSKIVILDCCFAGKCGEEAQIGNDTRLSSNTVILTACSNKEAAWEKGGKGVFTSLLLSGLKDGACDILGDISPAALYAYIDKALNSWEQRPFFKANVSSFVSMRKCKPRITKEELYKGIGFFNAYDVEYNLDPSYEFTNDKSTNKKAIKPYAKEPHVKTFKLLQKFVSNGLVEPVDEEFMYFAAMHSKSCRLTPLGQHYWRLCQQHKI